MEDRILKPDLLFFFTTHPISLKIRILLLKFSSLKFLIDHNQKMFLTKYKKPVIFTPVLKLFFRIMKNREILPETSPILHLAVLKAHFRVFLHRPAIKSLKARKNIFSLDPPPENP